MTMVLTRRSFVRGVLAAAAVLAAPPITVGEAAPAKPESAPVGEINHWKVDVVCHDAVLCDPEGNVLFSLAQQDMVAIRFVRTYPEPGLEHLGPVSVLVPCPAELLEDTSFDLWGYLKPRVEESAALAIADARTNPERRWLARA